ncbi:MAG: methylmalonyl-CoA epimerase [Marinilabiliaceae bacterium]|nr:methylmalonyl-CoA epimerase [Marinilabiliaceae bacterium]
MYMSHIDHIGFAVRSIEESRKYYENVLGLECYKIEEVPDQKVKTAFFKIGHTKIELLEATDPESPVAKFIEKKGPGFHHIAYFVDNVNEALMIAEDRDCQLIDKRYRKGADGMDIGFIHPKSSDGILTEFCSNKFVL